MALHASLHDPFKEISKLKPIREKNMKDKVINTKRDYIDLVQTMHRFNASEVETRRLLDFVDIIVAIDYYGITELLDTIGEERLRAHLEMDEMHQYLAGAGDDVAFSEMR
ncbi:hypothetical protein DBR11_20700 [Pedobacter sp. HMWF019]|uniref:hypothetical protein n=1 Tax=Pedobacter sp. HMWF019 TaxID=2056856 RepID=UPI000D3CB428|nr:hypothetical protein [Pedobacter sp. HMWF019]PTS95732.1 hypothetical protein DBR11_20700 [Pedobacter sp. HMWF019]